MPPETRPPGTTFDERWPHDASEREYLAGSSKPIVLGGLAGLFGVPLIVATVFLLWPLPFLLVGAVVLAGSTWVALTRGARTARLALRLWRVAAWMLVAAAAGLLITVATDLLCTGTACRTLDPFDQSRLIASVVIWLAVIAASVGAAVLIERLARRVDRIRRARAAHAP